MGIFKRKKRKANKQGKILLAWIKEMKRQGYSNKQIKKKFEEKNYPGEFIDYLLQLNTGGIKMAKKKKEEFDEDDEEYEEEDNEDLVDDEDDDENEEDEDTEEEEDDDEDDEDDKPKKPVKNSYKKQKKEKKKAPKEKAESQATLTEILQGIQNQLTILDRRLQALEAYQFRTAT